MGFVKLCEYIKRGGGEVRVPNGETHLKQDLERDRKTETGASRDPETEIDI